MRLTQRLLRPRTNRAFWWAVGLTLLAAVLRGADLLGRSLWMDEGVTYMRLAPSLTDMLRNVVYVLGRPVIDTQPPAYFLLLKAWILFGGDSEFSLKWLTAILGVVVVPLTFAVGKHAFGTRAGLIAAFFVLLSPGVQWYAHELRMYTAVICLAAFTVYALHRALRFRPGSAQWWLVVALAWALAMLTHYTFVGLVFGQALLVGVVALARWRTLPPDHKRVLATIAALSLVAVVGLLLLPDVQAAFRRLSTGREVNYNFVPLDVIFWTQFNGFLFGLNTPDPHGLLLEFSTWVVAVLCLISVVVSLRRRKVLPGWLVLVSVLMPVLVWFGISFRKPNYQGFRHLMLITPFMAVLLGQLAAALWQRGLLAKVMGGLLIAAITAMQVYGLAYSFIRTPNWHDDFRGLAHHIRDHWQDGDVIVIPGPVQAATVMPYLRGFPWRYFPESTAVSAPKAAIEDTGRQQARKAFAAQFRRVWYMPLDYETGDWFARDFFLRKQINFPSRNGVIQLELFEAESPITTQLPADVQRIAGNQSNTSLVLAGYRFAPAARFNPQPNTQLSFYWQRGASPPDKELLSSINTSFRLFYGGRPWWDFELLGELDAAPDDWEPGAFFRVDYVLPLPLGLPHMPYELRLELHQGSKGETFQSISESVSPLDVACCLRVVQWPLLSSAQGNLINTTNPLVSPLAVPVAVPGAMPQPTELFVAEPAPLADWWTTLRNSDATLMKIEYPDEVRAGEFLPVVLTWRANQPGLLPWQTELRLEPLLGSAVANTQREAGTPDFPVSAWPIHQPVRDDYSLQVPYALDAGWFKLVLLRQRAGAQLDSLVLGLVRVAEYPASPVPVTIQHSVPATVGDLTLLGWGLNRTAMRDTTLEFRTLWRVDARPKRDGVLFLHVFAPGGSVAQQPIAQDDKPPEYGKRLTLTYRSGEGIDQLHRVVLPPDAPAGEYKLFAGVYDRDKACCRWPAQQNGQPVKDDLVYLGSFSLPKLPELIFKTYFPVVAKP